MQAFRTDSAIAKSRATVREDGYVHEYHLPVARPGDTLTGHLAFAFRCFQQVKKEISDSFGRFVWVFRGGDSFSPLTYKRVAASGYSSGSKNCKASNGNAKRTGAVCPALVTSPVSISRDSKVRAVRSPNPVIC